MAKITKQTRLRRVLAAANQMRNVANFTLAQEPLQALRVQQVQNRITGWLADIVVPFENDAVLDAYAGEQLDDQYDEPFNLAGRIAGVKALLLAAKAACDLLTGPGPFTSEQSAGLFGVLNQWLVALQDS